VAFQTLYLLLLVHIANLKMMVTSQLKSSKK